MPPMSKIRRSLPATLLTLALLAGVPAPAQAQAGDVTVQYLGCSAVVVSDGRTSIGIDFWTQGAFKYSEDMPAELGVGRSSGLSKQLVSHQHLDHAFVPEEVPVLKGTKYGKALDAAVIEKIGSISVGEFVSLHFPPDKSPLENAVFVLSANGLHIVHLGDAFGTMADQAALQALKKKVGDVDVLMMPIGSPSFTAVEFVTLKETMEVLNPRVTIPMHYWSIKQKADFAAAASASGYQVVSADGHRRQFSAVDLPGYGSKTIWNVMPGKYVRAP